MVMDMDVRTTVAGTVILQITLLYCHVYGPTVSFRVICGLWRDSTGRRK